MAIIRVQGTDIEIEARDGEPVLAAFQRTGYSYIVGCKRGGCGICKLDIVDGEVEYPITVAQSVLPDEDRAEIALSCRSVACTDLTLYMPPDSKFKNISPFLSALAKAQAASQQAAQTTRQATRQAVTGAAAAAAATATGVALHAAADAIEASTQVLSDAAARLDALGHPAEAGEAEPPDDAATDSPKGSADHDESSD